MDSSCVMLHTPIHPCTQCTQGERGAKHIDLAVILHLTRRAGQDGYKKSEGEDGGYTSLAELKPRQKSQAGM